MIRQDQTVFLGSVARVDDDIAPFTPAHDIGVFTCIAAQCVVTQPACQRLVTCGAGNIVVKIGALPHGLCNQRLAGDGGAIAKQDGFHPVQIRIVAQRDFIVAARKTKDQFAARRRIPTATAG